MLNKELSNSIQKVNQLLREREDALKLLKTIEDELEQECKEQQDLLGFETFEKLNYHESNRLNSFKYKNNKTVYGWYIDRSFLNPKKYYLYLKSFAYIFKE